MIYQHLYFKGVFKVAIDKYRSFKMKHYGYLIENEIFWTGLTNGWEKESIKFWIKLCEKADIIFDIGANTGVYSLIAKAVKPASKVYAFEPVKRVYVKLLENNSLNSFDIVSVEKGVYNSNGTATIYDTESEHTYSVSVNKNYVNPGNKVIETKIETITLDSFIEEFKLPKIDLIKIDVETLEPEVLEGFTHYLPVFKPTILIEILTEDVAQRTEKMVSGLDYLFYNINENGSITKTEKIRSTESYNYLLCSEKVAEELGILHETELLN